MKSPLYCRNAILTAAFMTATGPIHGAEQKIAEVKAYDMATVQALWIRKTPIASGGSTPFSVMVTPNNSGDAAVGFIEHSLNGVGESWKSSAWIAAVAACNVTDRLVTEKEFILRVRGFMDGPSAGMLMAATMCTLINQEADRIKPGVTITGTINPDGTVGPVSGIDVKLKGAQAAGITIMGYPLIDDGELESYKARMAALGKVYNVTMEPVRDIFDAYKLLTGRNLGRSRGDKLETLDAAEMAFSPEQSEALIAAARTLLQSAAARLGRAVELQRKISRPPQDVKDSLAQDVAMVQKYVAEVEGHIKNKAAAMAQSRAVVADASARIAELEAEWQQALLKRDPKALSSIYDAQMNKVESLLQSLDAALSPGLDAPGAGARLNGFYNRVQFWVAKSQWLAAGAGRNDLEKRKQALQAASAARNASDAELKKISDSITKSISDTIHRLAILECQIGASGDLAKVMSAADTRPAPDMTALNRKLASAYGPAAAAGLAYFQSTVQEQPAANDPEQALRILLNERFTNDIALGASTAAATRAMISVQDSGLEESPAALLDRLACGVHAYLGMSSLMNKYYNLGGSLDMSNPVTLAGGFALRKGETVPRMIEGSRRRVLEEAAEVKRLLGYVPDPVKMSFNIAAIKSNDPGDIAKLDALTAYWRAHFFCRMAQLMAKAK